MNHVSHLMLVLAIILGSIVAVPTSAQASTIPTTSNPTGSGTQGVRIMANPSFEDYDNSGRSDGMICEEDMNGWLSTHPNQNSGVDCPPFELWTYPFMNNVSNRAAPDGTHAIELNAYNASMAYQPICMSGGETFSFQFHHITRDLTGSFGSTGTDTIAFRFGIPTLDPSSKPADSEANSLEVIRISNQWNGNSTPPTASIVSSHANTSSAATEVLGTYWVKVTGSFTTPAGFDGIRNLGFFGITPTSSVGNVIDDITIGLQPIVDLGVSRDRGANEISTPTALRIRINGRVESNTKIALRMKEGTATPDSDFRLGTVSAGIYGTASVTHTEESSVWLITVPAGDYDGGVVRRSTRSGLTIPIEYIMDGENESDEYAWFEVVAPGSNGSSSNWGKGDPTCDGSEKNDGVVYTIRNTNPTATPSPTLTMSPTNTVSPTNTLTPTPHPFAIKDVAVGASFTLAVLHNGTLVTWGFNREGQASLPRWMATKPVEQVEVGSNYAVVLGENGRVYAWGANDFGQMRIPTAATSRVSTISASLGHVMALKSNGELVLWGRNDFKQLNAPLSARKRVSAVAAGHSHSLAVKGGKVIAWGRNTWGQTRVPRTLTNVIAVAGGFDHSLALRSNGTVVCWGRNNEGQCKLPKGMKDVIAISAGVGYSLALGRDGEVYAWGRSNYGQATIPDGLSKAGAISAGYVNSVVGLRDASVVAFGNASLGALVSRTPTVTR
ncbi:MAG: RCC1 domain-containing protein [Roseiflexaceae bacterium]